MLAQRMDDLLRFSSVPCRFRLFKWPACLTFRG